MVDRWPGKGAINLIAKLFLSVLVCLAWTTLVSHDSLYAQTFGFDSGSTGVNGAFPPSTVPAGTSSITINMNNGQVTFLPNGTVAALPNTPSGGFSDGIFNFSTFNLASGITVSFIRHVNNPPVTILATGDITIDGVIDVSGKAGKSFSSSVISSKGGEGGPGGFDGGNGGAKGVSNNIGAAGLGAGGGKPAMSGVFAGGGLFGAASEFISLIPIFGGSGGGGGLGDSSVASGSGGGGGGAILLASSTDIVLDGQINANGGIGGCCKSTGNGFGRISAGGGGSGGAIRLVAEIISGTGSLSVALGGILCAGPSTASDGRIRLEAFVNTFAGATNPSSSVSITSGPGPVATTSNPALAGLPTLTISSVGGINAPSVTTGNLGVPDLALPQGTTNPLPVVITTNNIPVGTIFTVRVAPQFGSEIDVNSTATAETGNPGEASATAQINLPAGEIVTLSAFADFTIQTASLFPMINGEEVGRVLVTSNFGEKSQRTFFAKSGKIISN